MIVTRESHCPSDTRDCDSWQAGSGSSLRAFVRPSGAGGDGNVRKSQLGIGQA